MAVIFQNDFLATKKLIQKHFKMTIKADKTTDF